jgi:hypothetical protein
MGRKLNPIVRTQDAGERIQKQLDTLDLKLARPTQAITAALMKGEKPDSDDVEKFENLTAQKEALRELLSLDGTQQSE